MSRQMHISRSFLQVSQQFPAVTSCNPAKRAPATLPSRLTTPSCPQARISDTSTPVSRAWHPRTRHLKCTRIWCWPQTMPFADHNFSSLPTLCQRFQGTRSRIVQDRTPKREKEPTRQFWRNCELPASHTHTTHLGSRGTPDTSPRTEFSAGHRRRHAEHVMQHASTVPGNRFGAKFKSSPAGPVPRCPPGHPRCRPRGP